VKITNFKQTINKIINKASHIQAFALSHRIIKINIIHIIWQRFLLKQHSCSTLLVCSWVLACSRSLVPLVVEQVCSRPLELQLELEYTFGSGAGLYVGAGAGAGVGAGL